MKDKTCQLFNKIHIVTKYAINIVWCARIKLSWPPQDYELSGPVDYAVFLFPPSVHPI